MEVSRVFKPEDLQSDQVVEILYTLLRDGPETLFRADLTELRPADLLSAPSGVTHVVAITRRKRKRGLGNCRRESQ